MRTILLLAAAAAACKGSDKAPSPSGADKPKAKAEGPERISNHELASTPLQNVASTAGTVAFTIDLPSAALKPPEVKGAYSTWEPKKAWFDTPSFTVLFSEMPMSPDATGDSQPLGDDAKDRTIARAEKLPDGGYINVDQRTDHAFFKLEVCRPVNNGSLCCSVIQRADKPIDSFDESLKMAETICTSMKATR
ncbi:MAG TPA: hypothetical protein VMZ53_07570 [Kofleriaceae bacterium]|nr:hypothetical protein [Kofleriaceae bacterium]